jgi:hypothetical protein
MALFFNGSRFVVWLSSLEPIDWRRGFLEVDVAGNKAGCVRIGNVAGDDALAFRPQHQGLGVKLQTAGQIGKHKTPRLSCPAGKILQRT